MPAATVASLRKRWAPCPRDDGDFDRDTGHPCQPCPLDCDPGSACPVCEGRANVVPRKPAAATVADAVAAVKADYRRTPKANRDVVVSFEAVLSRRRFRHLKDDDVTAALMADQSGLED